MYSILVLALLPVFTLREDKDKTGRGMYPINIINKKSESRIMDLTANKCVCPRKSCLTCVFQLYNQGRY